VGGALADVVVVDLSRFVAGPHATMMLGDLGARVIKVEPPGGDDTRGWGPPFVGEGADRVSTYFLSCNRNKESVTADLRTPEGRDLLTRLVRRADVLCENLRPRALDRLGFAPDALHALNPRLVVLSITGFGHDGPEGGRAGYDQIAQGEAGLMSLTGAGPGQPTKVGVPIADLLAGMYGAAGVLAALHERTRTGRGQVVRTSLLAAAVGVHSFQGTRALVAGETPHPTGNDHPSIVPYGLFHAADAPIQLAVASERLWQRFAGLVGVDPDDPRFRTNADRVAHRGPLVAAIEAAFHEWPADELLADLDAAGVPAGRVRDLTEVYAWEQALAQGLRIDVDHPALGRIALPGPPWRFAGGADPEGRTHRPPPRLGEHDAIVRAWLDGPGDVEPGAPIR
jgi:crotonobetainyl-CoA:carnitine CoA-transferase CaiB-like acyl-CoA transferase